VNWDAIGAIAEALGALGVIATLVYLASQIRQAERATLASIQHSSIVQGFQLNVAAAAPETAPLILKGSADFNGLDSLERLRFTLLLRATFAWFEDIFSQAQRGAVDSEYWASRRQTGLGSLLQLPGIRQWWERDQDFFGNKFRDEVNRQLAAQQGAAADRQGPRSNSTR
jgi:hypothetical protein